MECRNYPDWNLQRLKLTSDSPHLCGHHDAKVMQVVASCFPQPYPTISMVKHSCDGTGACRGFPPENPIVPAFKYDLHLTTGRSSTASGPWTTAASSSIGSPCKTPGPRSRSTSTISSTIGSPRATARPPMIRSPSMNATSSTICSPWATASSPTLHSPSRTASSSGVSRNSRITSLDLDNPYSFFKLPVRNSSPTSFLEL